MKRLIVNADDLGLTGGVNRAIRECHLRGIVSTATLMATGARFDEAAAMAHELPGLNVGCHVVLVDGSPVLPPSEVRSLLAKGTNRFHYTISEILRAMATGGFRAEEVEAEAQAQFARLRAAGVSISHFDSHKHTHLFPKILRPLLRAAKANGIRALRNPFDAPGVIGWREAMRSRKLLARHAGVRLLTALLQGRWLAEVRASGLATTDGCLGVVATGSLSEAALRAMLERVPEGTWELVCHPGYNDGELDAVRTVLRGSREVEMAALTAITPEELKRRYGVELAGFRELGANPQAVAVEKSKS
jgi:predicted glycoside hydrolase/deacetylase ChbG (UPF0249 family)